MSSNETGAWQTASRFGNYRLTRMLGCGGMAEVWSGEVLSGERRGQPVALKRILPHLCDDLAVVEMFLSEARLATLLEHPNIIRTYEVGILERRPFIVMEMVSGVDLRQLSAASPEPLPIGFCLAVAIQICEALAYVHAATNRDGSALGLIHRDISPSNVMITRADGVVKLLDFGVAKAAFTSGLSRTRTGDLKGKLGYMAPELLKEERYDHRADLFSVGVVLYELLVKQRLFKASTEASMLMMNLTCQVSAPSRLRPEVPAALDRVVLRALSADPERRFGDAAEMMDALARLARERPWTASQSRALVAERRPAAPAIAAAPLPSSELPTLPMVNDRVAPGRPRRWRVWALGMLGALGVAAAIALIVGRTPPAPPTVASSRAVTLADPWAAPPRLDVVSSGELTIALPSTPASAVKAAVPPATVKRAAGATRPSDTRQRPGRHRKKAAETLMGQDELMNPLAQ
jgi:serine/threonine protein kinase